MNYISLALEQQEAIGLYLQKLGLEEYQEQVEAIILGERSPDAILRLLSCVFKEGARCAFSLAQERQREIALGIIRVKP